MPANSSQGLTRQCYSSRSFVCFVASGSLLMWPSQNDYRHSVRMAGTPHCAKLAQESVDAFWENDKNEN
jgi:hypothetical protein